MRIQLDILNAATRQEIDAAFAMIARERPDALFVGGDPFFTARRVQLVNLATRHAIPTAFSNRESAEIGGLMSYGTNIFDAWRQSGVYAGRVLRGAKPADLPVLQSTKFEFVINHQTARMLGVTVPDKLLVAADEVVDRRHATRHLHRRVHDGCRRGDGDLSAKRKRTVRAGLKSRCSTGSQRARSLAPPHQEGGAFLAQRRLCAAS
jgi:hypothetical protein